jgi:predicted component of type VI protein secretion system
MPNRDAHPSVYLKPSLLDRLSAPQGDDYMRGAREPGEEGEMSGMREEVYRDTVLRDLEWLFNAVAPLDFTQTDLRRKYPYAAASVLGFGLRGIFGRPVHDPGEIQEQVRTALEMFEPRLELEKIFVSPSTEGHLVEIEITGYLLTQRARRHLWIRTNLDTLDSRLNPNRNG